VQLAENSLKKISAENAFKKMIVAF